METQVCTGGMEWRQVCAGGMEWRIIKMCGSGVGI